MRFLASIDRALSKANILSQHSICRLTAFTTATFSYVAGKASVEASFSVTSMAQAVESVISSQLTAVTSRCGIADAFFAIIPHVLTKECGVSVSETSTSM